MGEFCLLVKLLWEASVINGATLLVSLRVYICGDCIQTLLNSFKNYGVRGKLVTAKNVFSMNQLTGPTVYKLQCP